jgi:hypothetical protein
VDESAELQKLRRDTDDLVNALTQQASVFDAPLIWHRFTLDGENEEVATGRIQLPRTNLYVLFRGAREGPYSPAGFRQTVANYRRALDDCLETLDGGFSIDPERR